MRCLWLVDTFTEERFCFFVDLKQPGALVAVFRGFTVFVVQLVPEALCEALHRFCEAQCIHLLHEGEHIPTLTAAKAVVKTSLWANVEAGTLLIVEGTQALHGTDSSLFERDVFADHVGDVYALAHLIDVGAPDSSSHQASLVRATHELSRVIPR